MIESFDEVFKWCYFMDPQEAADFYSSINPLLNTPNNINALIIRTFDFSIVVHLTLLNKVNPALANQINLSCLLASQDWPGNDLHSRVMQMITPSDITQANLKILDAKIYTLSYGIANQINSSCTYGLTGTLLMRWRAIQERRKIRIEQVITTIHSILAEPTITSIEPPELEEPDILLELQSTVRSSPVVTIQEMSEEDETMQPLLVKP